MKVALIHDFLTQLGGAERFLKIMHELFPEAPVYTLVYDENKTERQFAGWDIRTSFIERLPRGISNYKWYLSLMPKAVESFDLSEYDLLISDSSSFAKGVLKNPKAKHLCYCHTPTRFLWTESETYVSSGNFPGWTKPLTKLLLRYYLRPWDLRAAERPDQLIANSKTVQERIKQYYKRDSTIIYPPVDTEFFSLPDHQAEKKYYFTASRLEPYKNIELVVKTFSKLGLPLKVAGEGSQLEKLQVQSSQFKNIQILGRVSDQELRQLYQKAKAFIFPPLEDAGLMTLEALACGTPVIGLAAGGTAEFIREGENGSLFAKQDPVELERTIVRFQTMQFDPIKLRESVLRYSKQSFKEKIEELVERLTKESTA